MSQTLDELGKRLQKAKEKSADAFEAKSGPAALSDKDSKGLGLGLRITAELVAAIAVGSCIGYLLDALLGTTPWLMVVFLIIGCAAGFMTVIRTAQEHDRRRLAQKAGQSSTLSQVMDVVEEKSKSYTVETLEKNASSPNNEAAKPSEASEETEEKADKA